MQKTNPTDAIIQETKRKPSLSNQIALVSKVVLWISVLILIALWIGSTAKSGNTSLADYIFKIALAGAFTSSVILGLFALNKWARKQADIERAKRREAWRRKVANGCADDDDDDCYCINLTVTVTTLPSKDEDKQKADTPSKAITSTKDNTSGKAIAPNKEVAPTSKDHTPQDHHSNQDKQPE